ncbi:MAG: 4Fe-4S dicluster domain-containing protein [Clostridiales bacterium]|nr:4Fe-4S dicluster domain-containing protein [Clostridiales bacterium]
MNKLGFGFLRLPMVKDGEKDVLNYEAVNEMVDEFLALGGRYFDTAYTYLNGESEAGIRKCLVERYPRDAYELTDKLPTIKLKSEEDLQKFYDTQLERCGVEQFDNYLLHWLNKDIYAKAQKYDAFAFLRKLKAEGKVKKIGFSYHDGADLLEQILNDHPEVDIVQLQINYLDWESPAIQARKCYEVAVAHGKEVIVMEPIKGGTLVNLPEEALRVLRRIDEKASPASWALRFAQDLDAVSVVLSGMGTVEQIRENLVDFKPLTEAERLALVQVRKIKKAATAVPCTACSYCVSGCPKKIAIPQYFALYNEYAQSPAEGWKMTPVYKQIAETRGKASDCIKCRLCEQNCPQKLPITDHLEAVAKAFEPQK